MTSRLRTLSDETRELEARLRLGGGPEKIERQHKQGKLTARERIDAALRSRTRASSRSACSSRYDQYDGQAPGAGVVTGVGVVHGREVVVVANDATVKAGSWWPETIKKILRAQEIAMRCRIPIIYLVDSAGVNLPYQGGVFPGQYGAARIFYYNSIMRRYLHVPQIAAVMGPCIAGGAYLPALSDVILMVEGHVVHGARRPEPREGRDRPDRRRRDARRRRRRTPRSAASRTTRVTDDDACLREDPRARRHGCRATRTASRRASRRAARGTRSADALYDLLPARPPHVVRHACGARAPSSTTASSTSSRSSSRAR